MDDPKVFSSLLNLEIINASKLRGGINSSIYKLNSLDKTFLLKIYPGKKHDNRPRINTEIEFLMRFQKANIKNVPKLIKYNFQENWALLSWLEGEKPKSLNCKNIEEIIDFIKNMQKLEDINNFISEIGLASEACFSINEHYELLKNKISILIDNLNKKENNKNVIHYLNYELKNISEFININYSHICDSINLISPSDIGIHNMILKEDKLNFIDFEYAGRDDAYKLLSDLILQPNFILNIELKNKLIETFQSKLDIPINLNRLKILISMYRLKWCFIVYKKYSKSTPNYSVAENSVTKYLIATKQWGLRDFNNI